MASRRIKLIAISSAIAVGAAVYLYSVFAVQGRGNLAQAPLNVQSEVPPAFIMALDDSGSMIWETLNNTRDGVFGWNVSRDSFYDDSGVPYGYDVAGGRRFYFLFPYNGRDGERAIPPIDAFGFGRSPDVNPAYFDPRETYAPWKQGDGSPFLVINPAAAPVDPRPAGSPGKLDITINLTGDLASTDNGWGFKVEEGMVLPVGTRLLRKGGCASTPALPGNENEWATLTSATTIGQGTFGQGCTLWFSYYPATFYLEDPATLPADYGYTEAPVAVTDPAGGRPGTLYKYEIKQANFGTNTAAYTAAMNNFANWFSFYRLRRDALIGGVTNALNDVNRDMRVGWFRIHNRNNVTMRNMSSVTEKTLLFDEIYRIGASGNTPTRQAVRHLGEQFKRTDEEGAPVQLACQRNVGMLFTDGYINDGGSPNQYGNADSTLNAPYADKVSNTMADIVVPYYYDSLREDIEENLVRVPAACSEPNPDPRLDCRTNLHMNFYGVTLGTLGRMYGVQYLPDPNRPGRTIPDPYDVNPAWHDERVDLSPHAVDEVWHATINARGELINATRPSEITSAMRRVIEAVNEGSSPSGSIALTGARIGTGSLTVSPFYEARNDGTDWYSRLTAQTVSSDPITGEATFTHAWEASAQLPAPADRKIWFANDAGIVQPFTAANIGSLDDLCNNPRPEMSLCTGGQLAALGGTTPVTVERAVNYLRGDQTEEVGRNGSAALRFRTTRLGDIINSTPVVSSQRDDYGYRSLPEPYGSEYADYIDNTKASRRPMVYAGANDGMLHAFDGRDTVVGGIERFAYIPASVRGHMGNLLFPLDPDDAGDQKFQHRYFVDGPLAVSDAYYGSGWKTVLVGTTGAGARGAFALNVSRAARPSADDPDGAGPFIAEDRLWEINDLDTTLPPAVRQNIGHVLGKPVIVPIKTDSGEVKWRAVFGNGYNSISGKAVLFLVDIDSGAPNITMIEAAETGPNVPAGSNGLGNIVVVDRWAPNHTNNALTLRSRDGFADTVYAADQKGAVWKFDLREATPPDQDTPLFTSLRYTAGPEEGTRQPILGGLTASAGPAGGVLVYFGTGSFSFTGDTGDTTQQSLYGVLDNNSGTTVTRDELLQQTILSTEDGARMISTNLMTAGLRGWYIDLPAGERFVAYPRIESGVVFMPTYAPNAVVGCGGEGNNWLYGLNALNGAAGLSNVRIGSPTGDSPGVGTGAVTLDTGGTAPVKDVAVFTSPRIKPLGSTATVEDLDDALGAQCSMVVQVAGAPPLYLPRACGRQSWRQIQ